LRTAIADRPSDGDLTVDRAGWVVTLYHQEAQTFYGRSLEEALAWCPVWPMAPELGTGPFLA
jgi:hypothetical protein